MSNLVLVLWIDRCLNQLPGQALPPARLALPFHALGVLVAFNIFISARNATGSAENVTLLWDNQLLKAKLRSLHADRFLELDDGFTSYVAQMPAEAGLGLALDHQAAETLRNGHFLDLIYQRGYRVAIAHGSYAAIVDNAVGAQDSGRPQALSEIHASEFANYRFVPAGGDGFGDQMSFYLLVPRAAATSR